MRTLIALTVVLAVSLPAAAFGASSTLTAVKACANKKSGALRLLAKGKCTKKERALTLSQTGPAGAKGPAGAPGTPGTQGATGPTGPTGPTGTPDPSGFFTKSESDARYVQPSGTVNNSNFLGGYPAGGFVTGGFGSGFGNTSGINNQQLNFGSMLLVSGAPARILMTTPIGYIEVACTGSPAQMTISYKHERSGLQDVFIDNGGANPTHTSVAAGVPASAPVLAGGNQLERLIIQVGFGSTISSSPTGGVSTFVITAINGIGLADNCFAQGQAVSQVL